MRPRSADGPAHGRGILPLKAPPLPPVFSWSGFYAGADVGYAWPHLLVRAEYRYPHFGEYHYDSVVTFPGLTGEQNPRFNTVRIGAAYEF